MIVKPSLPVRSLKKIALRLGPYLSTRVAASGKGLWEFSHGAATPTLGPGFQIWVLGLNTLQRLKNPNPFSLGQFRVAELAENSRCWHLQIKKNELKTVGFAEATNEASERDVEEWHIHRMGLLPIAARELEVGLARLERLSDKVTKGTKIRILKIPGVDLGILWVESAKTDAILVFHQPPGKNFSSTKLYEWSTFVTMLTQKINGLSSTGPTPMARSAGVL